MRAAARRIRRFRKLEAQRDVLQIVAAEPGACGLWDEAANLVWLSSKAARTLDDVARHTLDAAVDRALRQRRGRTSLRACILGRPFRVSGTGGVDWCVELSCLRTREHRLYVLAQLRAGDARRPSSMELTRTERRVLHLITRGFSNREIGSELCVAQETVKTHVSRILGKLGVTSRAKAAVAARALGMLDESVELD